MKQEVRRKRWRPFAMAAFVLALATVSQGFSPMHPVSSKTARTRAIPSAAVPPSPRQLSATQMSKKPIIDVESQVLAEEESFEESPRHIARQSTDPTPVLFKHFQAMSKEHTAFAAVATLALALMLTPLPSFAAMSGGRMGGSFSAPRSSSGRLSAPRSSYGSGFSRGYGAGYYSRGPSVFVTPPIVPFYSPFYSPGYIGGPGIISYRGPGLLTFLLFGGLALAATSALSNAGRSLTSSSWSSTSDLFQDTAASALGPGTSVAQISVALEVSNRDDPNSILGALARLSRTARTDSRVGIQNLTSQVALELLRRKSSITSASTNYQHYRDRSKALRDFNSRSIKERGKFERETVSKYGGVDYSEGMGSASRGDSSKATMAVVTLLISIDGDSTKLPQIRSMSDVEDALRKIASDSKVEDCLQGAEILWTPEDRFETLSLRDVVADYPELRSV